MGRLFIAALHGVCILIERIYFNTITKYSILVEHTAFLTNCFLFFWNSIILIVVVQGSHGMTGTAKLKVMQHTMSSQTLNSAGTKLPNRMMITSCLISTDVITFWVLQIEPHLVGIHCFLSQRNMKQILGKCRLVSKLISSIKLGLNACCFNLLYPVSTWWFLWHNLLLVSTSLSHYLCSELSLCSYRYSGPLIVVL